MPQAEKYYKLNQGKQKTIHTLISKDEKKYFEARMIAQWVGSLTCMWPRFYPPAIHVVS